MRRANERRPYTVTRYRNVPMDHVLGLLTEADEDYFVEFHGRTHSRRRQQ
jgi:hypothetical protein